nr:hypothetical protein BaRGS_016019 [Batillaria attramentaria]
MKKLYVWGYSFLFVTLINLCSLTGILMLPCMNTAIYKTLLMFMVALAAFELVGGEDEEESLNYVWKASTVMGGVYLFFVTEYVMRMVNEWREINDALALNQQLRDALQHKETRSGKGRQLSRENSHHHHSGVAPVAYMVIFGDGLHNFIDGDFAILLNSGMRLKKALAYNFLSSLMCYFGLVMPEMNSAAESEDGQRLGAKKTFLLQNCGLLTGYSIILLIAVFGGQINFE